MSAPLSADAICTFCSAPVPRLYQLPARATRERRAAPACYFCYIRMTGIKPTRSRITSVDPTTDGAGSTGSG